MRIVVALGGNALLRRGEPLSAENQQRNIQVAAEAVAALTRDHEVIVTHGNGPQVGLLALQSEAYRDAPPFPLDVLGAQSEGMIGYLLEQGLRNALPEREVAIVLTQTIVDADDSAFERPSKPVGPLYGEVEALRLAEEHGWSVARDGAAYRRVVPSPEPRRIVELQPIRTLLESGVLVICAGGGGIPVVEQDGALVGVEAVLDKDLSSALLALNLQADMLLLLTDVSTVWDGWGTSEPRAIRSGSPAALQSMSFAAGSMGPKIEAACRFVDDTGQVAAIGALRDAAAIVRGEAGTEVRRGDESIRWWPDDDRRRRADLSET
jgi:carbamate kinase